VFVAALLLPASGRAQSPLTAVVAGAQASPPEPVAVPGIAPHTLVPVRTPTGDAAAAAKDGFVWDNRPSLRYGKSFRMDFTLIATGDVRDSSVDLADYGGAFEWGTNRIGVKGSFLKIFEYQVEHDVSSDGDWRDVFLNVTPVPYAQVRAGRFKIPFGYERLTSPADLDFVRRTRVTSAIAPGRATGVMVHGRAFKRVLRYEAAYFDGDGDEPPAFEQPELPPGEQWVQPDGWSWAGRATIAPLRLGSVPGEYNNLEIGGAFMSSTIPEGKNHLHGKTLIGATFFGRHYYTNGSRTRTAIEASWPLGPASFSTEYLRARDARNGLGVGNESQLDNDLPELEAKGWYIAGTYLITGEKKEGGVKPRRPLFQGGFGAIEIAARYETLKFSSDGGPSDPPSTSPRAAPIDGNGERAAAIGVNWYANRWVKVRADFVREQLDDPARGPAPEQSSFWTFVGQFQIVF
jgi:phosphate-selective porin